MQTNHRKPQRPVAAADSSTTTARDWSAAARATRQSKHGHMGVTRYLRRVLTKPEWRHVPAAATGWSGPYRRQRLL
jgi:hypothetical protein